MPDDARKGLLVEMRGVAINEERCRGCELCRAVCPQGALIMSRDLNRDGYHPVQLEDVEACTGCALCAMMCPHVAIIRVYR